MKRGGPRALCKPGPGTLQADVADQQQSAGDERTVAGSGATSVPGHVRTAPWQEPSDVLQHWPGAASAPARSRPQDCAPMRRYSSRRSRQPMRRRRPGPGSPPAAGSPRRRAAWAMMLLSRWMRSRFRSHYTAAPVHQGCRARPRTDAVGEHRDRADSARRAAHRRADRGEIERRAAGREHARRVLRQVDVVGADGDLRGGEGVEDELARERQFAGGRVLGAGIDAAVADQDQATRGIEGEIAGIGMDGRAVRREMSVSACSVVELSALRRADHTEAV